MGSGSQGLSHFKPPEKCGRLWTPLVQVDEWRYIVPKLGRRSLQSERTRTWKRWISMNHWLWCHIKGLAEALRAASNAGIFPSVWALTMNPVVSQGWSCLDGTTKNLKEVEDKEIERMQIELWKLPRSLWSMWLNGLSNIYLSNSTY